MGADVMEFCTKEMPFWYYTTVNLYDLREQGVTAPQEVAFGFLIARLYIDEMIRRGYKVIEHPCTVVYHAKEGYTHMRGLSDWWRLFRPAVLLRFGVKR